MNIYNDEKVIHLCGTLSQGKVLVQQSHIIDKFLSDEVISVYKNYEPQGIEKNTM